MNDRTRLRTLHEQYIEAVNIAVAEGRDDVVEELVATYPDDAARVLCAETVVR